MIRMCREITQDECCCCCYFFLSSATILGVKIETDTLRETENNTCIGLCIVADFPCSLNLLWSLLWKRFFFCRNDHFVFRSHIFVLSLSIYLHFTLHSTFSLVTFDYHDPKCCSAHLLDTWKKKAVIGFGRLLSKTVLLCGLLLSYLANGCHTHMCDIVYYTMFRCYCQLFTAFEARNDKQTKKRKKTAVNKTKNADTKSYTRCHR